MIIIGYAERKDVENIKERQLNVYSPSNSLILSVDDSDGKIYISIGQDEVHEVELIYNVNHRAYKRYVDTIPFFELNGHYYSTSEFKSIGRNRKW